MHRQFFLGDDILMVPVLRKKTGSVECYVPNDGWLLCWNNKAYGKGLHTIPAPIGQPCILVKQDTLAHRLLQGFVEGEA